MVRYIFVALALASSLVAKECDIDLGNIDQYVNTWQITARNNGSEPVTVTLTIRDKTQTATVPIGGEITVKSFKPGSWKVSMVGTKAYKALLADRRDRIVKIMDSLDKKSKAWDRYDDDLDDIDEAIDNAGTRTSSGGCSGFMEDKGGDELDLSLIQEGSNTLTNYWRCSGT